MAASDRFEEKQTITFVHRGIAYSVELDTSQAAEFDAEMAPFIAAARKVGGSRTPTQ